MGDQTCQLILPADKTGQIGREITQATGARWCHQRHVRVEIGGSTVGQQASSLGAGQVQCVGKSADGRGMGQASLAALQIGDTAAAQARPFCQFLLREAGCETVLPQQNPEQQCGRKVRLCLVVPRA